MKLTHDFRQDNPNLILFEGSLNTRIMSGVIDALNLEDKIPDPLAFGLAPDSELTDMVNHFLVKLKECGVMDKLARKWMPGAAEAAGNRWEQGPESGQALGFENLSFPFVLLAGGVLGGVLLSLFELACDKRGGRSLK